MRPCLLRLLGAALLLFALKWWLVQNPVFLSNTDLNDHTGQYRSTVKQEFSDASNSSGGPSGSHASAERYMIYYCKFFCGGWADRLKGIVFAYVIANLTNRKLGIQITDNPCSLTDFVRPNDVNWSMPDDVDLKSGAETYNKLDSVDFYQRVATSNLDDLFTSRVALFKANLDYFDQIKSNKLYQERLKWMLPLTRDQIFSRIYRKLFKFSPNVQRAVNRTLQLARPAKDGQLICAHLRFAGNSESLRETKKLHTRAHGKSLLTFLQSFDPNSTSYNASSAANVSNTSPVDASKVRFFVTSDSEEFIDEAARIFGDRFVRTDGQFVHVDKPGENRRKACDGFTKVLVDQYLLSTCDVLVLSRSGFGRQAAYLRGTDRGLFCILLNGTLHKCSASRLRELYGVLG